MLQQLAHILIISFICCLWGLSVLLVHKRKTPADGAWYRSLPGFLSFLFFVGCIVISIVASWFYLIGPLKFIYLLYLSVLPAFLVLLRRKKIAAILPRSSTDPVSAVAAVFFFGCLLLFIVLSCLPTANRDTNIYHLQIIQWTSAFPAVPGMANLFPRLGLGSNWFGLISVFDIPWLHSGNFSYLNVALAIWFLTWLFDSWRYHFIRRKELTAHGILCLFYFLLLLYSLFDWELFRGSANSTNYDLIVTACTLLLLSFLLEGLLLHDREGISFFFPVIALSIVAFKFSGIFMLLLLAWYWYYWARTRPRGSILFIALASLLILAPVLIRNYIITGYPLYPLSFSIGSPDWKMPRAMVDLLHNYIVLSNRFYNQDFPNSYSFKEAHSFWFFSWFKGILWQHRILVFLSLTSAGLFLYRTGPGRPPVDPRRWRSFLATLFLMLAGWFLTAPSPRLGYGVLLFTAFLPVALLAGSRLPSLAYTFALLLATAGICFYLRSKTAGLAGDPGFWSRPQAGQDPAYTAVRRDNVSFYLPEMNSDGDRFCVHTPLPCICQDNPYLVPRGASLEKGFRMSPRPDSVFIQNYSY